MDAWQKGLEDRMTRIENSLNAHGLEDQRQFKLLRKSNTALRQSMTRVEKRLNEAVTWPRIMKFLGAGLLTVEVFNAIVTIAGWLRH